MDGGRDGVRPQACKLGLEGIVSKRANSSYRGGQSRDWIKTKSPAAMAQQRIRSENWNCRLDRLAYLARFISRR